MDEKVSNVKVIVYNTECPVRQNLEIYTVVSSQNGHDMSNYCQQIYRKTKGGWRVEVMVWSGGWSQSMFFGSFSVFLLNVDISVQIEMVEQLFAELSEVSVQIL